MDIQFPSDIQVRYRAQGRASQSSSADSARRRGRRGPTKYNKAKIFVASPSPLPFDFEGQGTLLRKGVERAPRRTQAYPRSF